MSPYITEDDLRSGAPLDLVVVDHDGNSMSLAEWGNRARARYYSGDYTGVTHAGLALTSAEGVFLAQRADDPTDDPEVRQSWEFPGGALDAGEQPFEAAMREFLEETGLTMPVDARVVNGWRSPDGVYQCFVMQLDDDLHDEDFKPTSEVQAVGWFTQDTLPENLRPEVRDSTPWDLIFGPVSGNEEADMTTQATEPESPAEDAAEPMEEPDYSDCSCFTPGPLMIHGVLAPEATPSGDSRGFTEGAVTTRPLRLPFGWQEWTASGHDGSITVSSIDRMMRKDGLIHFEGMMMHSEKAEEFCELLCFFGQYGVSIDGVKGNIDTAKSKAEGMVWFDAVQVAGAVACSVPAFAEAYVAMGPHPDMPADNSTDAMTASGIETGDIIGMRPVNAEAFNRGPGWVTDPKATNRIHDYWTKPGQPGYEKIQWGKPGDFARAKALIGEKIAKHSPDKMRFLNQIIAQWHHDALGYWPATHAKMDRAGVKAAAGSLEVGEELFEEADEAGRIEQVGEREDGATLYELHPEGIETDAEGGGWETVLVSSAASRALPPAEYFTRHPDTGALVIEEPDADGFRRTYGYVGEWGVCHIGKRGRCVEVPMDPTGEFSDFHLGRTKTDEGYLNTGVMTYKVEHRDAETILSETAEQQHFDNIASAWCSVRLGQDERGIWFSGVVLPGISDDDIVVIEAAGQVSGEWLYGSLRAVQAVNVPGFAVVRASAAYDENDNVIALVASTFGNTTECEPDAIDRMAALRQAYTEAKFDALRTEWESRGA